mgnify:CR=1 FL=1
MPRLPKPRELRQNSERRDAGVIPLHPGREAPEPPAGLTAQSVRDWDDFWASPVSQLVTPGSDMPALRRLFQLRDERERMWSVVTSGDRVVEGSTGQIRPHPLYDKVGAIDAEVRQLEDRLGLNPQARLKLGVQLGEASRSLADINAALASDPAADEMADLLQSLAEPPVADPRRRGRAVDGGKPRPRAGRHPGASAAS